MDMAQLVSEGHGGAAVKTRPFPDDLRGKYQEYTCADLTKLRGAGYSHTFTDLETGVSQYVDILKRNDGYR